MDSRASKSHTVTGLKICTWIPAAIPFIAFNSLLTSIMFGRGTILSPGVSQRLGTPPGPASAGGTWPGPASGGGTLRQGGQREGGASIRSDLSRRINLAGIGTASMQVTVCFRLNIQFRPKTCL